MSDYSRDVNLIVRYSAGRVRLLRTIPSTGENKYAEKVLCSLRRTKQYEAQPAVALYGEILGLAFERQKKLVSILTLI